jgi:alpha-beta hydrolase superfamily lysophospholipase
MTFATSHKNKIRIISIVIIALIALNVISFFHAYKFTHFDSDLSVRTADPRQLSSFQKIKTLLSGIDNPRPVNTEKPDKPYKTVSIPYKNDSIECWYVPVDSSKGTVLLFHGYAGNKSQMIKESNQFNELGYNTILVDFLGSGGSTGDKTTIGFYESDQVKCVYDYFTTANEKDIIMFGTSMGSVAIMKSISDYNLEPRSIILECPFGDMVKTVQARFRIMNAPAFPMSYLLVFWGGVQNNFNAFAHNPTEYARSIKVKTLLMYGLKDNRVSKEETDLIFKNLQGPKELRLYREAGHESILAGYKSEWIKDIVNFIQ